MPQITSLSGVAATGPGVSMGGRLNAPYQSVTWQTRFTGTPTAITVNLEGSNDLIVKHGGKTTALSTAFFDPAGEFVAGDVGKEIIIKGVGAAGADLKTTIAAVGSALSITLTDAATAATAAGSDAEYRYGTWATLDQSTSTTAEMRHVVNKPVRSLRANIASYTPNGSTCTVSILAQ